VTGGPILGVSALVVDQDELLLVRRSREPAAGRWAMPGGRVEPGETLVEAVVRELYEETGLEGVCGAYVGLVEVIEPDHHFVVLDFRAHLLAHGEPTAGDDVDEVRWVPLGEVVDHLLAPGLGEFLHEHGVISAYC
jgi:8-oxo-dGTP diphosphatase